jgi:hypothetical protein
LAKWIFINKFVKKNEMGAIVIQGENSLLKLFIALAKKNWSKGLYN